MENFTYEKNDKKTVYETYEWDNTWIEHTENSDAKRVLYIGDSISCATRRPATLHAKDIFFDGFGTSKGIDNPYFKDALKIFAAQEGKRDAILINNGLHGWHLDDAQYTEFFDEMIRFLLGEFRDTPLFIVLTTHIADAERLKRVISRNSCACELAEKYGLPVIDLYSISSKNATLLANDGVHFTQDGYALFAEEIVENLRKSVFA